MTKVCSSWSLFWDRIHFSYMLRTPIVRKRIRIQITYKDIIYPVFTIFLQIALLLVTNVCAQGRVKKAGRCHFSAKTNKAVKPLAFKYLYELFFYFTFNAKLTWHEKGIANYGARFIERSPLQGIDNSLFLTQSLGN